MPGEERTAYPLWMTLTFVSGLALIVFGWMVGVVGGLVGAFWPAIGGTVAIVVGLICVHTVLDAAESAP